MWLRSLNAHLKVNFGSTANLTGEIIKVNRKVRKVIAKDAKFLNKFKTLLFAFANCVPLN